MTARLGACAAAKDKSLSGIGGERCGAPAIPRRGGFVMCDDCWTRFERDVQSRKNLFGILLARRGNHG